MAACTTGCSAEGSSANQGAGSWIQQLQEEDIRRSILPQAPREEGSDARRRAQGGGEYGDRANKDQPTKEWMEDDPRNSAPKQPWG